MPELVPTWRRLGKLAGGDELALRMLSLYDPPPIVAGCSQAALRPRDASPMLVRNYDFDPGRFERVVYASAFTGRRVLATSASLWGLVDGMNEDGLAVSVAFGGRRDVGRGFGIHLVARYLLETCTTVVEARRVLARLPVACAHNVTVLDRRGDAATVQLSPGRRPTEAALPVAANHQDPRAWPEHAAWTRSVERERRLRSLAGGRSELVSAFLEPPLRVADWSDTRGTLYTAVYVPAEGRVEYRWPSSRWEQSFARLRPGTHTVSLS